MSDIEYEIRILEIDEKVLIKKITLLGGKLLGEYFFRRYVFETIPQVKGRWIRLRTNGEFSTLAVKEIISDSVDGTSEWETSVEDFDVTLKMLEKMGFKPKGYQENRRIEYRFKDVILALDTWPLIPPYLEIEGKNEAAVKKAAVVLGFEESSLTGENTQKIYQKYGIDIEREPNLRLEKK